MTKPPAKRPLRSRGVPKSAPMPPDRSRKPRVTLISLSPELLLMISKLCTISDFSSLTRSCRGLYHLLNHEVYRRLCHLSDLEAAFEWCTKCNKPTCLRSIHSHGLDINFNFRIQYPGLACKRVEKLNLGFWFYTAGGERMRPPSLLMLAAINRRPALVRAALELGADPNELTVEEAGLQLGDTPGVKGSMALHAAIAAQCEDSVRILLEYGAEPNAVLPHNPATVSDNCLGMAAANGDVGIIAALLDHGANIDYQNSITQTAVYIVLSRQKFRAFKYLVDCGASVDDVVTASPDCQPLLFLALYFDICDECRDRTRPRNSCWSLAKILLEAGASLHWWAMEKNPIHYAQILNGAIQLPLRPEVMEYVDRGIEMFVRAGEESNAALITSGLWPVRYARYQSHWFTGRGGVWVLCGGR